MATVDLTELRVYQLAMRVGSDVWSIVDGWPWFSKQALGLQWVRAADSIAANISEGYGRFSFKENARFCYYARGSLRETETWLAKSFERALVPPPFDLDLPMKLDALRRQLDNYIHSLGRSSASTLSEDPPHDGSSFIELPPLEEFLAQFDSSAS
jgi:four helix bundle protein